MVVRDVDIVRASGCFGDQSSGGNATRQNVGQAIVNSNPTSDFPLRTGPKNTTWHSCSCSVALCLMNTRQPLVTRTCRGISAPWALMASVEVSSSNVWPCASFPRIRTATCIKTRWLRRRGPGWLGEPGAWPIKPRLSEYTVRQTKVESEEQVRSQRCY